MLIFAAGLGQMVGRQVRVAKHHRIALPVTQGHQLLANYKCFKALSAEWVALIHEDYPHLAKALIEDKVIAWLEMAYAPENYSPK